MAKRKDRQGKKAASPNLVSEGGSETIKVGLIGCGGRGTGSIGDSMRAHPGVKVMAVYDLFKQKAYKAAERFKKQYKDRCDIGPDRVFGGYQGYKDLCACDLDIICMATPPVFRPYHLMESIKQGKSVFMEKPVAVDPAGARRVIEAGELAAKKGLGITCGTQRRHSAQRMATLQKIHDGVMGELVGGQCYWNGGGIWYRGASEGQTELEWQCHNWYHFNWLCGDQVCEQHVHNIDMVNWAFQGPPKRFVGMGGRLTRDYSRQAADVAKVLGKPDMAKKYEGDIYCHIGTEMEYPNGARVLSMGRHAPRSSNRVSERVVGTKGHSNLNDTIWSHETDDNGKSKVLWKFSGKGTSGRTEEHAILIRTMKDSKPVNEARRIAESTLTAIGSRMSAYTGREISWEWLLNSSKLDLLPPDQMDALKPGDGIFHEIAVPGVTKLI